MSAVSQKVRRAGWTQESPGALCVIGSSTGGPAALETVIPSLPLEFSGSILVCQHMPPGFTSSLARRLDLVSKVRVREARDGEIMLTRQVLVIPGGCHGRLSEEKPGAYQLKLEQSPPVHGARPSVDVVLSDASRLFGPNLLVAILTGMGYDGARGALMAKNRGARVICQDEATSTVWGMPRACIELGAADEQVPLARIAAEIQAFFEKRSAPRGGRV